MLRILVVEDNQEKLREVYEALATAGCDYSGIDSARDAVSAKQLLR